MKIGTTIYLDLKTTIKGFNEKYRCKVIEKTEDYLYIDYPVHIKTAKTNYLPVGTSLKATYIDKDQNLYCFYTQVILKKKLTVPALAIKFPKKETHIRIQRREYVRIKASVDIAVHSLNQGFRPFTSVTEDISGGGLSIILPPNTLLKENDKIDTWLILHMHSGINHYINAEAEIIRNKIYKNKVKTVSVKFTTISKHDREVIIRYCFEKQRETRNKELV